MSPSRTLAHHRSRSSIKYDGLTPIKTSLEGVSEAFASGSSRSAGVKQRYFVLVQYGPELDVAHREGGQGGSILSFLQPTVHLQLVNVLPQLQLPSPLGLALHLHVPSSTVTPRIDDSIWNHMFAKYLLATATSAPVDTFASGAFGGLPIAAHLELRVDTERARWWGAWRSDPLDGRVEKWVDVESRHAIDTIREGGIGPIEPSPRETAPGLRPQPGGSEKEIVRAQPKLAEKMATTARRPAVETCSAIHTPEVTAASPTAPASPETIQKPKEEARPHNDQRVQPIRPFFSHSRQAPREARAPGWYPAVNIHATSIPSPMPFAHVASTSAGGSASKSRRTSLRRLGVKADDAAAHSAGLAPAAMSSDGDPEPSTTSSPIGMSTTRPGALIRPTSPLATPPHSALSGGSLTGDELEFEDATIQTISPRRDMSASGAWPVMLPIVHDRTAGEITLFPSHPTSPLSPEPSVTSPPVQQQPLQHRPSLSAPTIPLPPLPESHAVELDTSNDLGLGTVTTDDECERVSKSVATIKAQQDLSFLAASEKLALKSTSSLRRPSARPHGAHTRTALPGIGETAHNAHKTYKHASLFSGTTFEDEVSLEAFSRSPYDSQMPSSPPPRVGLPPRASRMMSLPEQETVPPQHRASVTVHAQEPRPEGDNLKQAVNPTPGAPSDGSATSLASSTPPLPAKDSPKRPLKRISSRIGFSSLGDVDPRPPLNRPHASRTPTTTTTGLYSSPEGYPHLEIYSRVEDSGSEHEVVEQTISATATPGDGGYPHLVDVEVHSSVYPALIIYSPLSTKIAAKIPSSPSSIGTANIRPRSIAIRVSRVVYPELQIYQLDVPPIVETIPILLQRFDYPNISLYPPQARGSMSFGGARDFHTGKMGASCGVQPVAVGLIEFQYPAIVLYHPANHLQRSHYAPPMRLQDGHTPTLDPIVIVTASLVYPNLAIYARVRPPSPVRIVVASAAYPSLEIYARRREVMHPLMESNRVKYKISSRPALFKIATDISPAHPSRQHTETSPELVVTPGQSARPSPLTHSPLVVGPPQKPAPLARLPQTPDRQPLESKAKHPAPSFIMLKTPEAEETTTPPAVRSPQSPHQRSRSSTMIAERTRALLAQVSSPPIILRERSSTVGRPSSVAGKFPVPPMRSDSP